MAYTVATPNVPNGTSVALYAWQGSAAKSLAGAVVETQTVSGGTVTFSNATAGRWLGVYTLAGQQSWFEFAVGETSGGGGGGASAVPVRLAPGNLGSAYAVDFSQGANLLIVATLNANCTLSFANITAGCQVTLRLTQDATGGRTLTFPAGTLKPNGNIVLSAGAGAVDVVVGYSPDGTNMDVFLAGLALA